MAVRLLVQDWEIFTNRIKVDIAAGHLMHGVICYARRGAPL
jgi:hypothetical protein